MAKKKKSAKISKAPKSAKTVPSARTAQLVSIGRASELLGVHHDTLRAWERQGTISPVKTPGNHRRYSLSDINGMRGIVDEDARKKDGIVRVAVYCRVSSHEQKEKVEATFEEVSSGMADVRCKLKQLFRLIEERKIDKVVIEHRDRLCRFMFEFLTVYFKSHGVEIEWMEDVLGKTYEQELVEDMLALMSSFSNRIYGRRSAENRKARKLAEMANSIKKSQMEKESA
jgi:excisionase family DNA binding protein